MTPAKNTLFVVKLLVTVVMLWLLLDKVELGPVANRMRQLQSLVNRRDRPMPIRKNLFRVRPAICSTEF